MDIGAMNTMNRVAYQLFCGTIVAFLSAGSTIMRDTYFVVHASHIPDYMIKIGSTGHSQFINFAGD
jgi:hypothetical protein